MLFGVCATTQSSHGHWDTLWEYTKYLSFGQFIDWLAAQITEQCMWRLGADLITGFKALLTRGLTSSWFQDHKLITATCVRKATSHMVAVITLRYWTNALFWTTPWKVLWIRLVPDRIYTRVSSSISPFFSLIWIWARNLLAVTFNNHYSDHCLVSFWNINNNSLTSNPLFCVCDSDHNGTSFYNLRYSIILYIPLLYPDSLFYYSK